MEAFLAKSPELKESAQRAFVAYAKSVFLMKNKDVFDINALDTDSYATSLGLAIPPRIRFLQRHNKKQADDNKPKLQFKESDEESNESESEPEEKPEKPSKPGFNFNVDDGEEDILQIKRKNHDIEGELPKIEPESTEPKINKSKKPITKAAIAKRLIKKKIIANTKTTFTEDGEEIKDNLKQKQSDLAFEYENEDESGINIEKAKLVLKEEDKFDKQRFKLKIKEKHRLEKQKLKQAKKDELEGEQDDFGSDSEYEPDLSWMPDPDAIYGSKEGSEDEYYQKSDHSDSGNNSEEDIPIVHKPTKRKLVTKRDLGKVKPAKKQKRDISKNLDGLSVNETEELAMQLLRG